MAANTRNQKLIQKMMRDAEAACTLTYQYDAPARFDGKVEFLEIWAKDGRDYVEVVLDNGKINRVAHYANDKELAADEFHVGRGNISLIAAANVVYQLAKHDVACVRLGRKDEDGNRLDENGEIVRYYRGKAYRG